MDGNGRWAKKRFLPRISGHTKGLDAVQKIIEYSIKYKIPTLTLYAFSTENWNRPTKEIDGLMKLFSKTISNQSKKINKNNIQIKILGDVSNFSKVLRLKIIKLEEETASNNNLNLNIALNYGGRSDIVNAVNNFYSIKANRNKKISEKKINNLLYTGKADEVDLLIRTGGYQRVSNFLLWQIAYSELFFTKTLWPDFNENDFIDALHFFQKSERKFGNLTGENLNA
jgi:undecaprenyl diphosphate synthase|tara:strand:+ start:404 stop:1084 length:681 start_codon:yes stop_codon:yes gene_type:complete